MGSGGLLCPEARLPVKICSEGRSGAWRGLGEPVRRAEQEKKDQQKKRSHSYRLGIKSLMKRTKDRSPRNRTAETNARLTRDFRRRQQAQTENYSGWERLDDPRTAASCQGRVGGAGESLCKSFWGEHHGFRSRRRPTRAVHSADVTEPASNQATSRKNRTFCSSRTHCRMFGVVWGGREGDEALGMPAPFSDYCWTAALSVAATLSFAGFRDLACFLITWLIPSATERRVCQGGNALSAVRQ